MIKKPNIIILTLIVVFVIAEILFLRPSQVDTAEEPAPANASIETMAQSDKDRLKDDTGYTFDGFHYTAVEGETKHWQLTARQAIHYEKSKLVLAHQAVIRMFDAIGRDTEIRGDIARYAMGSRDIELTGNVTVQFPDGFWIETSKVRYDANTGLITSAEPFHGETGLLPPRPGTESEKAEGVRSNPARADSARADSMKKTSAHQTSTIKPALSIGKAEHMEVWGTGFRASRAAPDIHILSKSHVRVGSEGDRRATDVHSDKVKIDREKKVAYFSMYNSTKFVNATQGDLEVTSRQQEVTFDSRANTVYSMVAHDDVKIVDTARKKAGGINYATSQRAEFLRSDDKVLLSGFPSVYRERETFTGERMIYHWKKGIVEVDHANAFHDGH